MTWRLQGALFALPVLGAAALALASAGCSKKTAECNLVVEAVNRVDAAPKGGLTDAKAHAAALTAVADVEDATIAELGKLTTSTAELGPLSARLQAAFKANAGASRELAALLAHVPDAAAQQALDKRIAAARDAMDGAEQSLARRCGEAAASCEPFAALLKKQPDSEAIDAADAAKTKAWSDGVAAWCAELAKVEVKDADLKRDLETLQKGLRELASVVVELSQLSADGPKREVAHKEQERSAKEIGALVDELNKLCQTP